MTAIQHELVVHAPIARVYEALATADRISTWWGPEHGVVQLRVVQLNSQSTGGVGVRQHAPVVCGMGSDAASSRNRA